MPAPRLPRRTGRVHTVPLGHLHGRMLTAAALTPAPAWRAAGTATRKELWDLSLSFSGEFAQAPYSQGWECA